MRYLHIPGIRRIAFAVLFVSALAFPTMLRAQPIQVQLGEYGGTATLVRTESGRYTWNGQPVFDGSTITSLDGKRYVLSFSAGQWRAGYLPRLVQVPLGSSGSAITLRELENGQYWWNGLVESGLTITAADGDVYRLTFTDGLWSADFVPDVISIPLGQSGGDRGPGSARGRRLFTRWADCAKRPAGAGLCRETLRIRIAGRFVACGLGYYPADSTRRPGERP